jgi:polyribonucleotide nucleotidyltransferase
VANPADEVSEGQEVMVKCIGIDEKSGKIKLSRKALIPKPEGADAEPEGDAPARDDRPRRPRPPPSAQAAPVGPGRPRRS